MAAIEERIVDRHVRKLLRALLRAGVMEDGLLRRPDTGTPQGGVVSPLLCNLYLHRLDRVWAERGCGVLCRYADDRVPRTQRRARCRRTRPMRCCTRDGGLALRGRPAGGGRKPPRAAPVKSRGGERRGEGAPPARQVWITKASASEPPMTCRKRIDGIETGVESFPRDEPGGCLPTGPGGVRHEGGASVVRALVRNVGTCRPDAAAGQWRGAGLRRSPTRDPQAAGTARGRVAMRGTGADRPVVALRPGNAGGAKGTGRPGWLGGQPPLVGGAG
jgi:hypothetical protein